MEKFKIGSVKCEKYHDFYIFTFCIKNLTFALNVCGKALS